MAVERCTHCGKILYPNKTLIAYHGMLFCSYNCCRAHEYFKKMALNKGTLTTEMSCKAQRKEIAQKVADESEKIIGSDIGIDWPQCPLALRICDDSCPLFIDDGCALAAVAACMFDK